MWPGERESLAVWADQRMAAGDAVGEIVALHLRAGPELAPADREELLARAEQLRLRHAESLLGPLVGELPRLRLRWQYGVIRGISLDRPSTQRSAGSERPRPRLVLEVMCQLLRRPALAFLDDLQLDLGEYDDELELGLLAELGSERCHARPRRLILGGMPRRFRDVHGLAQRGPAQAARHAREDHLHADLLAPATARGLTWFCRWGRPQSLPWTPGDAGSRVQALHRLLGQPWTEGLERALGCAMWDTSVAVRRDLFFALDDLPDAAAPLWLAALAIEGDIRHGLRPVLERGLTRVSGRPAVVAAIAQNFAASEPWVATWLGGVSIKSRARAQLAAPRIEAMLDGPVGRHGRGVFERSLVALSRRAAKDAGASGRGGALEESIAELLDKRGDHEI
ncbi:hypothetical protein PPSIR1_12088 [Plesiocystis pacifica SIR-1]|uniref:Uncharacterized protein n=1 Tax=Plesiocystis pacifica SIR-1 TaxID=391625 RepID=A6G5U7_9BACT|nr:hypothetical protein [Plesiocystis pacifica]EDM78721.1 hypothetical protein PPSIR1_12088 [Plesiocystis pacifica SIR-1]